MINSQSSMKGRCYYYPHLHMRNWDLERLIKFPKVTKPVRWKEGLIAWFVRLLSLDFDPLCYAVSLTQMPRLLLGRVIITYILFITYLHKQGYFQRTKKEVATDLVWKHVLFNLGEKYFIDSPSLISDFSNFAFIESLQYSN